MPEKTIQPILDQLLCCGCGACAGSCPVNAISMLRNPAGFLRAELNTTQCICCGKCRTVCPSFPDKPLQLWQEPLAAWCGYAKDPEVRANGQSGGIGTALLLYLLETKQVDAVVVTRLHHGTPETICTSDPDTVRASAGSVYAQTAVVETVLKNQEKRLAVVALGCQARAIRKALPDKNILIIGLICGGNMSLRMKDQLLKKMGIRNESDGQFRYRDKKNTGWPGGPSFQSKTGLKTLEPVARMKLKPVYECYRCIVCPEKMNLCADVVLGDPWGITAEEMKKGKTVVLAYSEKGKDVLECLAQFEAIMNNVPFKCILNGQRVLTDYQRRLQEYEKASIVCLHPQYFRAKDAATENTIIPMLNNLQAFYSAKDSKAVKRIEQQMLQKNKEHKFHEGLFQIKRKLFG